MSYSLPVNDFLPQSFKHQIIHSQSGADEVFLRANIQREDDIKNWILEFSRNSKTQWNLRTSKPTGTYVICMYVLSSEFFFSDLLFSTLFTLEFLFL